MAAALDNRIHTATEYLARERTAPCKSELRDSHVYAMTGASRTHNLVSISIAGELRNQLKRRACAAYVNAMRVKAQAAERYHDPDVVAVCGEPQLEDAHGDTLLNPAVLVEVLSDSTEAYDRGEKFAGYRKIPTLREYLLVSQTVPRIERYLRQDGAWLLTEAEGLDASIAVDSIGCRLALREAYDRVLPVEPHPE